MARSVEALVEPRLLVWSRNTAGLGIESAAKKIGVSPDRLERWERGEARPTIKQLRELGRIYRRPIAVFYLPEPPAGFEALRDFRRLPGVLVGQESSDLLLEIRKAQDRRDLALELYSQLEGEPPRLPLDASLGDEPEHVAHRVRGLLEVTYEDQVSWSAGYQSFNRWRSRFEQIGVLVFQATDVDLAEMRGFSIFAETLPAVVVNIKDAVAGRIFTMLHELTHILLRQEGLCNLLEAPSLSEEARSEVFCNRVASAALMPRDYFLLEPPVTAKGRQTVWSDDELHYLANRYGVSREAALTRLLVLGRTTEQFYESKREELLAEYAESRDRRPGFAPPDRIAVSSAGHLFVRLVLDCYRQDYINASDVADFLNVRLKHLNRITSEVTGGAR